MARRAQLALSRICRVPGATRPAPTLFHYPGLTARAWHERDDAPFVAWVKQLEAATPAITEEYLRLRESGRPSDYAPEESDHGGGLHEGGEWDWQSFIDRGRVQHDVWQRCPVTAAALSAVPRLCLGSMPFAFAFFSTLRSRSRILAHHSPCNLRVRVHLPLLVPEPESCGIRVGDEVRRWNPGEALIFDDAFEHEVWNDGDEDRVVLLFDLWHWELTDTEVESIQAMFDEVDERREARQQGG
uniref:Aspartyl/asparaginy/proline hydroxylase domain-containing protein n=1 Tax=Coccolithus braarudii TaxID=221442 RepID=A0A7S0L7B5_9EUKA